MKQGHGRLQRADGSVYEGTWEANIIVGTGRATIAVGDKNKRDGLPKEVRPLGRASDCVTCADLPSVALPGADHAQGVRLLRRYRPARITVTG